MGKLSNLFTVLFIVLSFSLVSADEEKLDCTKCRGDVAAFAINPLVLQQIKDGKLWLYFGNYKGERHFEYKYTDDVAETMVKFNYKDLTIVYSTSNVNEDGTTDEPYTTVMPCKKREKGIMLETLNAYLIELERYKENIKEDEDHRIQGIACGQERIQEFINEYNRQTQPACFVESVE